MPHSSFQRQVARVRRSNAVASMAGRAVRAVVLPLSSVCLALAAVGCSQLAVPVRYVNQSTTRPAEIAYSAPEAPPATPSEPAVQRINALGLPGSLTSGGTVVLATDANLQQHTDLADGADADVGLDPSGQWMVYSSTRHAPTAEIYLQRVNGASVIQLTNDNTDDVTPTFSPDGKWIAFSSNRSGNWAIYVMDVEGKTTTQVTGGNGQDLHPTFSPDGRWLAYCSMNPRSGAWELWVTSLETGQRRLIGPGLFPVWSPDTTVNRIAYQRARQRGSQLYSLWTLDLVDGEARRVTEIAAAANAAIVSPAWSPDGSKLTFTTLLLDSAEGPQQELWVIGVDGTNRQRLTGGPGTNLGPWWGVDNRVYFVSDRSGRECIWSVRADALVSGYASGQAGQPGTTATLDTQDAEN